MNKLRLFITLSAGLFLLNEFTLAHHGRGTRYDMDSEIALDGTIQEFVWRNPHVVKTIRMDQGFCIKSTTVRAKRRKEFVIGG